jgi:hypothetical protein
VLFLTVYRDNYLISRLSRYYIKDVYANPSLTIIVFEPPLCFAVNIMLSFAFSTSANKENFENECRVKN